MEKSQKPKKSQNFRYIQLSERAPKYGAYSQARVKPDVYPFSPGQPVTILVAVVGKPPRYLVQAAEAQRVLGWVFEDDLEG